MTRITLDEQTLIKLTGVKDGAELCDQQGNVVGLFQRVSKQASGAPWEPKISKDEMQRILSEPGARTLDEIMADLRKLP